MKQEKKLQAVSLRKKGFSMNYIAETLEVSKGSVSLWVSKIPLSKTHMQTLREAPYTRAAVEKRRSSRLHKSEAERQIIIDEARQSVGHISERDLFCVGTALYWGEGTKKKRSVVEITNTDPNMIKIMMKFLKVICKVPVEKFRGHVYIHEHMPQKKIERYWSRVSEIPKSQFFKTTVQKNRNRLKNDTLPYGTFAIIVCDTKLKLHINGWMEALWGNL